MMDHLMGGDQFVIEENGSNLSSGQRERIAIARALMRKPELVILDEATANIDLKSESCMLDSIAKMYPHMSIILITHRVAQMKKFDQIIVLKEGKLTGSGTHSQLLKSCGLYSELIMHE